MLPTMKELTAALIVSIIPFTGGLPIGDANQRGCVLSDPVPGCMWPGDKLAVDMDDAVSMGPSVSLVERADELVTARAEDFSPPCPLDGECPGPFHEPLPGHPCPHGNKDCFGPLAKRTEVQICPLDEDCSGPPYEPIPIVQPCPLGEDCIGPIDKRTEDYLCLLKGDCPEPHPEPPRFPHPCPLGEDCSGPLSKRTEEYTCPLDEECPGPFHEPPFFHHPCPFGEDCPPPGPGPRILDKDFPALPDKRAEDFVHPCPLGEDCPGPVGGPLGLP